MTRQWRHYFEIVLFSVRTLKTASQKQRCLCQKFLFPIPIYTWKISWTERLIYFLRPHMANWSHLTLMWQSNVCHGIVFIISFCFCRLAIRSQAFEKNASVHPFDLTVRKKEHSFSCSTQPFEKNLCPFSRSKKIYIRSAVRLHCSKTSVQLFVLTVRKNFASVQPCNRFISNGLSSHFLSVRLPHIQPFERISVGTFLHERSQMSAVITS